MRFVSTQLDGVVLVDIAPDRDERGLFARIFCRSEFSEAGLPMQVEQANLSSNTTAGTVRGLHFTVPPGRDRKVVRCVRGALYDVVVDVRPHSTSYLRHVAVELDAVNRTALHVPAGCAHGFQTLMDDTEVVYLHSQRYAPAHERGLRFDDPALGLTWPLQVSAVSDKDRAWPLLETPT